MTTDSQPDLLVLHGAALGEVARLVAGVSADQRGTATPCPQWSVDALIGHLVAGNRRFAAAATGSAVRAALDEVAPETDHVAYEESARATADAWRDPAALQQEKGPMLLTIHIIENLVHGWDLARATGQDAAFGDDILDAVEPMARSMMPAERPAGSGFEAERSAPAGASRLDQLAAFYGREV